jgi:serine/threonine protein kinase
MCCRGMHQTHHYNMSHKPPAVSLGMTRSEHVLHADIKLENIMFLKQGHGADGEMRLLDFGGAASLKLLKHQLYFI